MTSLKIIILLLIVWSYRTFYISSSRVSCKGTEAPSKIVTIPNGIYSQINIQWLLRAQGITVTFNPFHAIDLFWYPLKTSENLWFSDVFRGYQKRSVAWNGLMIIKSLIGVPLDWLFIDFYVSVDENHLFWWCIVKELPFVKRSSKKETIIMTILRALSFYTDHLYHSFKQNTSFFKREKLCHSSQDNQKQPPEVFFKKRSS